MKRKMLMSVLFSFAVCCAYSFEPSLYVMDELRSIQIMNELRYHYTWGVNSGEVLLDAWEKGITITQTFAIREGAWSTYKALAKAGFKSLGEPRTIAEVELMASVLWETTEYALIVNDIIMREEK